MLAGAHPGAFRTMRDPGKKTTAGGGGESWARAHTRRSPSLIGRRTTHAGVLYYPPPALLARLSPAPLRRQWRAWATPEPRAWPLWDLADHERKQGDARRQVAEGRDKLLGDEEAIPPGRKRGGAGPASPQHPHRSLFTRSASRRREMTPPKGVGPSARRAPTTAPPRQPRRRAAVGVRASPHAWRCARSTRRGSSRRADPSACRTRSARPSRRS